MDKKGFEFVNFRGSLLETMKKLYDTNQLTDIKLNVQGAVFNVHKPVLYHSSPMLKGLLTAETEDKYNEEIKLQEVDIESFKNRASVFLRTGV